MWFLWPISTSTIQSLLYLIFWFCFTVRKSWLKQSATNWKAAALWLVPDSKLGILQQFIRKNLKSTLLLVFFLCVYMLLICMPAYCLYGKKWNEITDEKLSFLLSGSFHFSFFVFWSKWPKNKKNQLSFSGKMRQTGQVTFCFCFWSLWPNNKNWKFLKTKERKDAEFLY